MLSGGRTCNGEPVPKQKPSGLFRHYNRRRQRLALGSRVPKKSKIFLLPLQSHKNSAGPSVPPRPDTHYGDENVCQFPPHTPQPLVRMANFRKGLPRPPAKRDLLRTRASTTCSAQLPFSLAKIEPNSTYSPLLSSTNINPK